MNYAIRKASASEITLMLDWAKDEGWNPGLHDYICFSAADPEGFFVGCIDDVPIASLSAVRYQNFGFLGLYIVKPAYRGKGFGFEIWKHGMDYLQDLNIGLDGVISQQSNYEKLGFKAAHRNIRYSGLPQSSIVPSSSLADLRELPFDLISAYDHRCFPSTRSAFLSVWMNLSLKALAIIENRRMIGYGVIRKCFDGYKIGPLFSESTLVAEQIFLGLCDLKSQSKIYIDIPAVNTSAMKMVETYHFKPCFETTRMYLLKQPTTDLSNIYGITSLELG